MSRLVRPLPANDSVRRRDSETHYPARVASRQSGTGTFSARARLIHCCFAHLKRSSIGMSVGRAHDASAAHGLPPSQQATDDPRRDHSHRQERYAFPQSLVGEDVRVSLTAHAQEAF